MRIPLIFSSVLVQHVVFTVYYLNRVMAEVNVILRIFFSDPKKVFFNVSLRSREGFKKVKTLAFTIKRIDLSNSKKLLTGIT